MLQVVFEGNK